MTARRFARRGSRPFNSPILSLRLPGAPLAAFASYGCYQGWSAAHVDAIHGHGRKATSSQPGFVQWCSKAAITVCMYPARGDASTGQASIAACAAMQRASSMMGDRSPFIADGTGAPVSRQGTVLTPGVFDLGLLFHCICY